MPEQITEYKCPACTGPLHFVGESGKLECDYCGNRYDVAEIEKLYAEKDAQAQAAFQRHGGDCQRLRGRRWQHAEDPLLE